jgi:hypothetical protein
MGDRANILFKEVDGGEIYFYTHWGGYDLPDTLAEALDRGKDRWNDEAYLARIIFCQMTEDSVSGTTGFGISTWPAGDAQYPPIVVDVSSQTVTDRAGIQRSFADYIKAERAKVDI